MVRSGSITAVVLFAFVFFLRMYRPAEPDASLNRKASAFVLPEARGGQVDFESYRGRPAVLVFWSTSCADCSRGLPLVSQLAPEFRSKGIAVITIHLGDTDQLHEYLFSNHIAVTCLMDPEGNVGEAYHVVKMPRSLLIDRDGTIKQAADGPIDESLLRKWMDAVAQP
jgi:peroxiredoxin